MIQTLLFQSRRQIRTFQELNGIRIKYKDKEVVDLIVSVAFGQTDEEGLYGWVKDHIQR